MAAVEQPMLVRIFDRYVAPLCVLCGVIGFCVGIYGMSN